MPINKETLNRTKSNAGISFNFKIHLQAKSTLLVGFMWPKGHCPPPHFESSFARFNHLYPIESITDADDLLVNAPMTNANYEDDLTLLANTPA